MFFRGYNECGSHKYGYLVHIYAPSNEEVINVNDYFSGQYKKYGINIQYICDNMCSLFYVSVSLPGSNPDINAFGSTCITHYIEDTLPNDYFFIGDMAYPCSNNLLTPYPGKNLERKKLIFNYYLIQIRVKI